MQASRCDTLLYPLSIVSSINDVSFPRERVRRVQQLGENFSATVSQGLRGERDLGILHIYVHMYGVYV